MAHEFDRLVVDETDRMNVVLTSISAGVPFVAWYSSSSGLLATDALAVAGATDTLISRNESGSVVYVFATSAGGLFVKDYAMPGLTSGSLVNLTTGVGTFLGAFPGGVYYLTASGAVQSISATGTITTVHTFSTGPSAIGLYISMDNGSLLLEDEDAPRGLYLVDGTKLGMGAQLLLSGFTSIGSITEVGSRNQNALVRDIGGHPLDVESLLVTVFQGGGHRTTENIHAMSPFGAFPGFQTFSCLNLLHDVGKQSSFVCQDGETKDMHLGTFPYLF